VPPPAGGPAPFAPDVAIPALQTMRDRCGEHLLRPLRPVLALIENGRSGLVWRL